MELFRLFPLSSVFTFSEDKVPLNDIPLFFLLHYQYLLDLIFSPKKLHLLYWSINKRQLLPDYSSLTTTTSLRLNGLN